MNLKKLHSMKKVMKSLVFLLSVAVLLIGCKTHSEIEKSVTETEVKTETTATENEKKDFHEEKTDKVERTERDLQALDSVINDRTVEVVLNDKGDTLRIREKIKERHVSRRTDNIQNMGYTSVQKADSVSHYNNTSVVKNDSVTKATSVKEKKVTEKSVFGFTYWHAILALVILFVILYIKFKYF